MPNYLAAVRDAARLRVPVGREHLRESIVRRSVKAAYDHDPGFRDRIDEEARNAGWTVAKTLANLIEELAPWRDQEVDDSLVKWSTPKQALNADHERLRPGNEAEINLIDLYESHPCLVPELAPLAELAEKLRKLSSGTK